MTTAQTPRQVRRNRMLLLAIFAVFLGSLVIAGALRFAGWRPAGMKNHGELLQPPGDLRAVVPRLVDGGDYHWNPGERMWRIALAPPVGCTDACVKLGHEIGIVWQLMGKDADHVEVLWIGVPPPDVARGGALRVLQADAALRAGLPRVDGAPGEDPVGVPVYVIDPNGFVILRYAPGFDPSGLRADLARLLKLM
ncbi:MAG: hypothetical protein ABIO58_01060 [Luteimonas sp.]